MVRVSGHRVVNIESTGRMAPTDVCWLISFVVVLAILSSVECLRCVRCSSLFDRSCESGRLPSKNCSIGSRYCLKYEGLHDDMKFVVRDCAKNKEESGCRMKEVETKLVQVCFTTCSTDGCNSAATLTSIPATHLTVLSAVLWCRHVLMS